ncbi:hypothetical protein [Maricaulis sp. CAU 1757]
MARAGWTLQRQVTLGVLLALALQTSGALVWSGRVGARLEQLERSEERAEPVAERLARLETEMRLVREGLGRIERRMDDG